MSIATEITRLQTAKADLKTAIEGKGVTVPSATKIDGYADLVDAIQTGGGGTDNLAERLNNTLLEYYSEDVTKTSDYSFYGDGANKLKTLHLPNCTVIGANLCLWNSGIETARFPKATSIGGNGAFSHASKLSVADIGLVGWIPGLTFEACTALTTIIIRKTNGIAGLASTNVFNSSRFANGGAGGTIYLPEVIYNHLGDGTSLDYQSASNWATIYGYGTITWAKLEGSAYESGDWSA